MSAEREQHGVDSHVAGGTHEAQHTHPGHGSHEEHRHATGDDRNNGHGSHAGHAAHGANGKHAGHSVEMFRRRFWWSLLLTVPLVATSHMVMDWFGYSLDFPGIELVGPVLGSVVFVWGGWPFLAGWCARGQGPPAGDDAADRHGDHRRLRRRRWPRRSAGSTWTSGGSSARWSRSCCSGTGRR